MTYRYISGVLPHHDHVCALCDGTGFYDIDDSEYADCVCEDCDGSGVYRWLSWYESDTGECGKCHAVRPLDNVWDDYWLCFDCYVAEHKRLYPECKLWRKWEVKND